MKAIVVSTPRTCSSYVQNIFANKFDLIDYSEIFSDVWVKADVDMKMKIIKRSDNYTAKITSTSFATYPQIFTHESFPWQIFDYIVLTERLDIAEQAASWLLLSHAQFIGKGEQASLVEYLQDGMQHPQDFPDVNRGQLHGILKATNYFRNELKPYLLNSGLKSVKLVNHEMFQKSPEEYIDELRDKTDIYWRIEDLMNEGNPTYVDYTPYIETKNLRQIIEEVQNELKGNYGTQEKTNQQSEGTVSAESQGTI